MYLRASDTAVVEFNHSNWNLNMKLIKFIVAATVVASTSLVSGGNAAPVGVTQDVAIICPVWPHCRDVDFSEPTTDAPQHLTMKALHKVV
jgi:hypothetical protein